MAWPVPSPESVKIPGLTVPTGKLTGVDAAPSRVTTTLAVPPLTFHGNWALICPPLTNSRGDGVALIVTPTPPIFVERGIESACEREDARLFPKIEIREPGATV